MHQYGLFEHAIRKSRRNKNKNPCSLDKKNQQHGKQDIDGPIKMNLLEFSGAFFVFGVGIGFSFVTLIIEFILNSSVGKRFNI